MLNDDLSRLRRDYPRTVRPEEPDLLRLATPLHLELTNAAALGDEIIADLDTTVRGIGWWKAYPDIDQKTRILLSDYLTACARAIPDNLIEAQIERLELDHAVDDFRKWFERGVNPGRPLKVRPPRSPYEELGPRRAQTHLTGMLRAWGTALDCIGGCIVGVAGLPADLVRADMGKARSSLATESKKHPMLEQLRLDLERAEADAGPTGWREWLLGMRHTVVHRGRRTAVWAGDVDRAGLTGFSLQLPVSPELTEVDAVIRTGGQIASTFQAPAAEILGELSKTVGAYVDEATRLLAELWRARRTDPALLVQSPKQWKAPKGLINPVPVFRGFPPAHATAADTGDQLGRRQRGPPPPCRSSPEHEGHQRCEARSPSVELTPPARSGRRPPAREANRPVVCSVRAGGDGRAGTDFEGAVASLDIQVLEHRADHRGQRVVAPAPPLPR
jgi:hypothetical protein